MRTIPIPRKPDALTYWILAGVVGSIIGAYVYQWLKDNDPI